MIVNIHKFLKCSNAYFLFNENTNCITTVLDNSLLLKTFWLDSHFERKISEYIDI